jgi:hypothetical protein
MDSRITELPDDPPAFPSFPSLSGGSPGVRPADPTPGASSGTVSEVTPAERFERLKTRISEKREQQAIEEMKGS